MPQESLSRVIPTYVCVLAYPLNKYNSIRNWLWDAFGMYLFKERKRLWIPTLILDRVLPATEGDLQWIKSRFSLDVFAPRTIKKPNLFERNRLMTMFVTLSEASFLLNIEEEDLEIAVKEGYCPAVKVGRQVYIPRAFLEQMLKTIIPARALLRLRHYSRGLS